MKAIRKNATKETIKFNIFECKNNIVVANRNIKYHIKEIRKANKESQKYYTKMLELYKLLKSK